MIIGDFHLECIAVPPDEADSILIVDPDAVLSCAVAFEGFQAITGEKSKIREQMRGVNLNEFSLNNRSKSIESLGILALKNQFRISGSKRSNHVTYYIDVGRTTSIAKEMPHLHSTLHLLHSGNTGHSPATWPVLSNSRETAFASVTRLNLRDAEGSPLGVDEAVKD